MTAFGLHLPSSLDAINVSICDSCTMEMKLPQTRTATPARTATRTRTRTRTRIRARLGLDLTWQWPWLLWLCCGCCDCDCDSDCSHCQLVSLSRGPPADLDLAAVAIAFNRKRSRAELKGGLPAICLPPPPTSPLFLSLSLPLLLPFALAGTKGHYNLTYKADIRHTKNCTFNHCRGEGAKGGERGNEAYGAICCVAVRSKSSAISDKRQRCNDKLADAAHGT